jgi:hypothetical protein
MGLAEARAGEGSGMSFSVIVLAVTTLFCLLRAIVDFSRRRYGWALAGLVCAVLLISVPLETHAVKFDLYPAAPGR